MSEDGEEHLTEIKKNIIFFDQGQKHNLYKRIKTYFFSVGKQHEMNGNAKRTLKSNSILIKW